MFKLGAARIVALAIVFLATGIGAAVVSNSYVTIPWRIRTCSLTPPRQGLSLADCAGVSTKFYYSGSLYLGVERELIESLEKADVVILGNIARNARLRHGRWRNIFETKGCGTSFSAARALVSGSRN